MSLRIHTIERDAELLRRKSASLTDAEIDDKKTQKLINDLIAQLEQIDGAGLAAPQVGYLQQIIVVHKEYTPHHEYMILLNPRLASASRKTRVMEEGCLSIPQVWGMVARPVKVRVKAKSRTGVPMDIKAKGLLARILQHEIDHLQGILFIDKAVSTDSSPKTVLF